MVAEAQELQDRPLPVRFFGQELALYRGKSGRVVMLEQLLDLAAKHLVLAADGAQVSRSLGRACQFHYGIENLGYLFFQDVHPGTSRDLAALQCAKRRLNRSRIFRGDIP